MEDDLRWKMTMDGGRPLKEDDLGGWKTTLDGRHLGWKITLDRIWPWMENILGWKMTLAGRHPLDGRKPYIEDDPGWETTLTLDRRQPWIEDNIGFRKSSSSSQPQIGAWHSSAPACFHIYSFIVIEIVLTFGRHLCKEHMSHLFIDKQYQHGWGQT